MTARVIFGDTDAMGIVYYGSYLRWFEVGRVELLRRAGIVYRDLTDRGIHLPVIESCCRYLRPARYDDEIQIYSKIEEIKRARIRFSYRIEVDGETATTGYTEHAFTDETGKVIKPPPDILNKLMEIKNAG
jgi:acyl-CoA thioester hydrolase